ncbi:hypothetical protein OIDMADRAFT_118903, partial [Oidiodendron maius Zn]
MSGLAVPDPIPEYDRKHAKKRIRAFTSNDRASHRIIEKQRREALNQNFLELARLIPNLTAISRLSKSLIVKETVEYLREQRKMQLAAAGEVRKLLADYDNTLKEVNTWRTLYSQEDIPQLHARPMSDALVDL